MAQVWANQCTFEHDSGDARGLGESNIIFIQTFFISTLLFFEKFLIPTVEKKQKSLRVPCCNFLKKTSFYRYNCIL